WTVVGLFLHATRCGLLDLSWEILCPNCRSSRAPLTKSLQQFKHTAHCDVCQIQFDGDFDKSVELKFSVHSSVRSRDEQTFCLAGPGGKPHIISQLLLAPGETRAWKIPATKHSLRLRSPHVKETKPLTRDDIPRPRGRVSVVCDSNEFSIRKEKGELSSVYAINPNSHPVLLCLEQIEWTDDILTAARVTNWQEFRDLFATEVISPTEQVTVGAQVVLFTDLCGSTSLYHSMGDAPAYALVRDHFSVL